MQTVFISGSSNFVITNIYFKPVFTDFINMAQPSTSTVSIYLHNYQFK